MENKNKKTPASKQVYEYILNGLIEKKYAPGTPLREERLCEECNCSATPVREALRQLEKAGWLTNLPYRGCVVRVPDEAEINELFFLREAIESRAAFMIAGGEADLTPLKLSIEGMEAKISGKSQVEVLSVFHEDLNFHRALLEISQLPRLAAYAGIWDSQMRSFTVNSNWVLSAEDAADILDQHKAIFSALCRHWERSAESLVHDHIVQAQRRTLSAFLQHKSQVLPKN